MYKKNINHREKELSQLLQFLVFCLNCTTNLIQSAPLYFFSEIENHG